MSMDGKQGLGYERAKGNVRGLMISSEISKSGSNILVNRGSKNEGVKG